MPFLVSRVPGLRREGLQKVEGAVAEGNRFAIHQQPALQPLNLAAAEARLLAHGRF